MKLRHLLLERKVMTNLDSILKSRDITLPTKVHLVKAMVFQWSCMDVRVGLWRKLSGEELMLLNCGLEKILESPLDCKEIQQVRPKGDQSWVFLGRTDAEAEAPILWPPDVKSWIVWKDPDAWKDWGEEKGTTGGDGWIASLTQWMWVWVDSRSWWWAGRPGVLWFMGSQRVGHDWATELRMLFWFLCLKYSSLVYTWGPPPPPGVFLERFSSRKARWFSALVFCHSPPPIGASSHVCLSS